MRARIRGAMRELGPQRPGCVLVGEVDEGRDFIETAQIGTVIPAAGHVSQETLSIKRQRGVGITIRTTVGIWAGAHAGGGRGLPASRTDG